MKEENFYIGLAYETNAFILVMLTYLFHCMVCRVLCGIFQHICVCHTATFDYIPSCIHEKSAVVLQWWELTIEGILEKRDSLTH